MGKYRYLGMDDRRKIEQFYRRGDRVSDIATALGVHQATIYKELRRGDTGKLDRNMRQEYSAKLAQRRIQENFKQRGRQPKDVSAKNEP